MLAQTNGEWFITDGEGGGSKAGDNDGNEYDIEENDCQSNVEIEACRDQVCGWLVTEESHCTSS